MKIAMLMLLDSADIGIEREIRGEQQILDMKATKVYSEVLV